MPRAAPAPAGRGCGDASIPIPTADPEDIFKDTRMSFGDHIEELRSHLLRAIYGFVVGMVVALIFAKWVFAIITGPVEAQLMEFYNQPRGEGGEGSGGKEQRWRQLDVPTAVPIIMKLEDAERCFPKVPPGDVTVDSEGQKWVHVPFWVEPLRYEIAVSAAQRQVGRPPMLSTLNVMEAFMVYFKVVAVTGLVISSPWVFYQLWAFVAAGLYPHEKKYVHKYLPLSIGLFLAGVVLCQVMVIPNAIRSLLVVQPVARPGAGPAAQRVAVVRHPAAPGLRHLVPDAAGDAVLGQARHHGRRPPSARGVSWPGSCCASSPPWSRRATP